MRVRARVCVCERERGGGRMQQYLMGIGGTVGRERERERRKELYHTEHTYKCSLYYFYRVSKLHISLLAMNPGHI